MIAQTAVWYCYPHNTREYRKAKRLERDLGHARQFLARRKAMRAAGVPAEDLDPAVFHQKWRLYFLPKTKSYQFVRRNVEELFK